MRSMEWTKKRGMDLVLKAIPVEEIAWPGFWIVGDDGGLSLCGLDSRPENEPLKWNPGRKCFTQRVRVYCKNCVINTRYAG